MKQTLTIVLLCVLFSFSACSSQKGTTAVDKQPQKISAEDAYARMQSGDPVIVVDVRTAEEYASAHIPDAILIPNEEIGAEQPQELPDLDAEILVYCRSGNRSAQAAQKLHDLGYTNIFDFGGINAWPYDTVTGE